jgi:hypothetical protein
MLLHCGGGGGIERNRVIILLMASTDMRLGALSGLRFEDFTPVPEYGIYKTQVYTRTLDEYYTFCTPECKEALDAYRSFRESHDETIVKDYLRHIVKSHKGWTAYLGPSDLEKYSQCCILGNATDLTTFRCIRLQFWH